MLQTVGKHGRLVVTLLLSLTCANQTLAAQGDRYRAEMVLIQRVDSAQDVDERMQSRHPSTPGDIQKTLLALNQSGQAYSDLDLVAPNQLYLSNAARRLKNSGRFRILMQAGWYQSFPPNYNGERMRVAVGDLLPTGEPGEMRRAVEGYISIDRKRYLHVTAHLNQWEKVPPNEATSAGSTASSGSLQDGDTGSDVADSTASPADNPEAKATQTTGNSADGSTVDSGIPSAQSPVAPKIQLLTWLHETRRMRSEEIHYLGSPTIGLLVYFAPVKEENETATPDDDSASAEEASESADSGGDAQ